jgi:microcin C transport system substrate-binding protein
LHPLRSAFIGALALIAMLPSLTTAGEITTHGLSSFGDLKYGPDFKNFDYVNPTAPKGGKVRIRNLNTFDSVNPFILKGVYDVLNADIGGDLAYNFASLMTRAHDEPDAVYKLVAQKVTLDTDGQWVEFQLRPEARFHDASPITANDIAYTFKALKTEGHPRYRLRYKDIENPVVIAPDTIRFPFREGAYTRGLALTVAQMPILSEKSFENRTFKQTTMEPFLGSGPYKISKVDPGRSVTYQRIKNHWADALPVHQGRYNFDEIQVDYYRDRTIALEAFFAGEYDFREEFTSRNWAKEYQSKPTIEKGWINRDTLKDASLTGFQAFFFNTRRDQYKDIRVRRALSRLFDFEWTNKNLFYGSYERLTSVFENSDMKASGVPSQAELALLSPWKDQLPKSVFGEAVRPAKTKGTGNIRGSIHQALSELKEAGWTIKDKKLVNETGQQMKMEFLLYEGAFTRIINPFIRNLERVGVAAKVRIIDVASWQNRLQNFDFDVIVRRLSQAAYPGVEQRNWWGSAASDTVGGLNIAGIKSPAIDDLVEKIVNAPDKDHLFVATRALDRVLMSSHYTIPQWYKASHFVAYWDKFGRPDKPKPGYSRAMLHSWWYDTEKAAKIDAAKQR